MGTDCDSPQSLINETFRWIEENLKDQIDFVVWTGDSARHDNDERIPRTENQIEEFNEAVVDRFESVFGRESNDPRAGLVIPIVPNIGNNDVMPHNIFNKGPNRWTQKLSKIWDKFIPEEQRHTFMEGGWFHTEVIPNNLVVVSLNTLYFFDSNNAVDGCADKSEPGYQHFEWLRVQLQLLRERGMKALLIGHVPPAHAGDKQAWDETCWQKYTLWMLQYRDVIVGSMYGHMNIDHFMLQDSHDIMIPNIMQDIPVSPFAEVNDYENFTTQSKSSYLAGLRDQWSKMPSPPASMLDHDWPDEMDAWKKGKKKTKKFWKKIGGPYAERYSVSLVSPSVVPNYYPTLRVIEYNISGIEKAPTWADVQGHGVSSRTEWIEREAELRRPKSRIPDPPSKRTPPGPAYSNQPLTLLSYAQYYANLTRLEESKAASTNKPAHIDYELEYHSEEDDVYRMPDLTVRSFFKLASRVAKNDPNRAVVTADEGADIAKKTKDKKHQKKKNKKNKVWYAFLERAFVGFLDDDELEDIA